MNNYYKKCILMRDLIIKYKPNSKAELGNKDYFGNYQIIIKEKSSIFSLLYDCNWKQIKKRIDIMYSDIKKEDCEICFFNKKRVNCTKCNKYFCGPCYIKIYKIGQGIVKCPFCRFCVGNKIPECFVELGIEEIKMKLQIE